MEIRVNGVICEYTQSPCASEKTVLFLHGWGGDIRSFAGAHNAVKSWGINAVSLAFPPRVPSHFGIYDYAECVSEFMREKGITAPVIVGHSFGGRLGIILAAQGKCGKLVLVDSAGLKSKPSVNKKIALMRYRYRVKHGKPLDGLGSVDYNRTEGGMRAVFVRIVNTHLDRLLPYIKCPTLIFWGKRDRDTPPYMAKRLHRAIKGSKLVMADGGHYSYLDADCLFGRQLKSFITDG